MARNLDPVVQRITNLNKFQKGDTMAVDTKLTTKKRKALPASAFCAPNRGFPAHDCAHVRAGLSLLGRYKGPGDKGKIRACLYRKARAMNCFKTGKGAKKSSEELEQMELGADFKPAIYSIMDNYIHNITDPQQTFADLISICTTASISSSEMEMVVEAWYFNGVSEACGTIIGILSD
jgi:hypothetical protein